MCLVVVDYIVLLNNLCCIARYADSQLYATLTEKCMIVGKQYIELYEVSKKLLLLLLLLLNTIN